MLKELYPLKGIITVLNTPYTIKGAVDLNALKINVKEALRAGVNGFLLPAMASEVNYLLIKEKIQIVEVVPFPKATPPSIINGKLLKQTV